MKKILLLALLAGICATAQAQKFYARAGVGYAFTHAGQIGGTTPSTQQLSPFISGSLTGGLTGSDFTIKKVSFSTGPAVRVAGGYMFSKNIGIDLEGSFYLTPAEHKLTVNAAGNTSTTTYTQKATLPILLTPALVLQSGGNKLNAYTRFGITLPLSAKTQDEVNTVYNDSSRSSLLIKSTQSPRFSIGFSAAAGVKYRLASKLSVWAEASLLSMSLYAKESELTERAINGVNNIDLIPQDQRIYKYEFTGNTANSAYYTYSVPFSNIATCIGISYDF
ncbi:MAG: hypothetical protein EOP56_18720 [Sphingobacteriales bacterium]|nr:MAG: hypothetical protein EOP56_18720 [Sphingobacteriales bacterium]